MLVALVFLLAPVSVLAADLYVNCDTGDNTGNDCLDSGDPCATPYWADLQASDGDTIYVTGTCTSGATDLLPISTANTTWTMWGTRPELDANGFTHGIDIAATGVTIEYINIANANTHGIRVQASSDDVIIDGCRISDNGDAGIYITDGEHDALISNNFIEGNGQVGIQTVGDGTDIINNSLYQNGQSEIRMGDTFPIRWGDDFTILNNILDIETVGINIDCHNIATINLTSDYNILYGGLAKGTWDFLPAIDECIPLWQMTLNDWQTASGQDSNGLDSDPDWVNAGNSIAIELTSPAMNSGTDVSGYATMGHDFDGDLRPLNGDYERGGDERDNGEDGVPEYSLFTIILAITVGLGTFAMVRRFA